MAVSKLSGTLDFRQPAIEKRSQGGVENVHAPGAEEATSAEWQEAQERVLFYLKLVGLAPGESLELARRALELAVRQMQHEKEQTTDLPTAMAMRALHMLLMEEGHLLEKTPFAAYPFLYRRWRKDPAAPVKLATEADGPAALAAVPPIKRGFMKTKRM